MHNAELFGKVIRCNYAQPRAIKGGQQGWSAQPVWADADKYKEDVEEAKKEEGGGMAAAEKVPEGADWAAKSPLTATRAWTRSVLATTMEAALATTTDSERSPRGRTTSSPREPTPSWSPTARGRRLGRSAARQRPGCAG